MCPGEGTRQTRIWLKDIPPDNTSEGEFLGDVQGYERVQHPGFSRARLPR
jgi:hypothetical protein